MVQYFTSLNGKREVILQINTEKLNQSSSISFKHTVSLLSSNNGSSYFVSKEEKTLSLKPFSPLVFGLSATTIGKAVSKTQTTLEAGSIFGSVLGIDSTGSLIGLMQSIKIFVALRYIWVDFGESLSGFLDMIGEEIEPKLTNNKDFVQEHQNGTKGKFSMQQRLITTSDVIYLKILVYFISWFLKIVTMAILYVFDRKKEASLPKLFYYYAFFQEKFHYGISNSTLVYGSLLSARTILHSKIAWTPSFMLFD